MSRTPRYNSNAKLEEHGEFNIIGKQRRHTTFRPIRSNILGVDYSSGMDVNFPPTTPQNLFTNLSSVKAISADVEAEETTLDMGGMSAEVSGTLV
jgi:hypothetical protein